MLERLSLQRLLKINVVRSRLLVEKIWACSMSRFWSTDATASVIFCSSCVGKLIKIDLQRNFETLNVILQFDYRGRFPEVLKNKAVLTGT